MKIKVEYKTDNSNIPYCAFTHINEDYSCEWSGKSFEDAKYRLVEKLTKPLISVPKPEEVEIEVPF